MTPEEVAMIRELLSSAEDVSIIALLLFAVWNHRQTAKAERRYYRGVVRSLIVALVVALAPEPKIENMQEAIDYEHDPD